MLPPVNAFPKQLLYIKQKKDFVLAVQAAAINDFADSLQQPWTQFSV
ncbi:MAG TPA: hypothetical protein VFD66_08715 [Verrucomicrobiae bacterium]|nr:hypothetical protein [Verrucomicrobiae bacterium]